MVFAMRTEFLGTSLKASTAMKAAPAPKAPAVQAFFKKAEKQVKSAAPKATQVRAPAMLPMQMVRLHRRATLAQIHPCHVWSLPASPLPQVLRKAEKDVKKATPKAKSSLPSAPKLPSFGTVKKEVKKAAPPQVSAERVLDLLR